MEIEVKNELGTHRILAIEWPQIAAKAVTKRFFKSLEPHDDLHVTNINVARTGTVYVTLERGDWNEYYKLYGEWSICSIRISNHESAAGKWSFDGRTNGYTTPDVDVNNSTDIENAIKEIIEVLS